MFQMNHIVPTGTFRDMDDLPLHRSNREKPLQGTIWQRTLFGFVYVAAAVVTFSASFMPLWVPAPTSETDTDIGTYSIWTFIPADGGGPAFVGLLRILALAGLETARALRPDLGQSIPVILIGVAVVSVSMLLTKPATGSPEPVFGPGAGLLFGSAVIVGVTAFADLLTGRRLQ